MLYVRYKLGKSIKIKFKDMSKEKLEEKDLKAEISEKSVSELKREAMGYYHLAIVKINEEYEDKKKKDIKYYLRLTRNYENAANIKCSYVPNGYKHTLEGIKFIEEKLDEDEELSNSEIYENLGELYERLARLKEKMEK